MNYFKRIGAFALCLVLLIGLIPAFAHAEYSAEILHSSGLFYYAVDDGEIVITRGAYDKSCPREGWPITMTIPDMINGYPVVRIEKGAFWSWYALDTVYLPNTLEEIGNNAFKACDQLRVVDMPHVISIGNYAFQDCSSLECINIPGSAEYMGKFVFWRCKGVRELIIGEVTGKRPDHYLDWDYASALCEIGSPETVKIGNIVKEFDMGYIFRNELRELWVAKSVNMSGDSGLGIRSDTLVYGYSGSTAEAYAEEQEVTFIPLDDDGTAEEPLSMELTDVYPARGESCGRVDDLKLSFSMTPARNVYGGSIYIKNRRTDETLLELDWEQINRISVYNGNTVSLPGVLDDLGQGDYYVLVDKGLFTAERVNDSGILYAFPGITQKDYWTFSVKGNPILEINGGSFEYYSGITKETESYSFDYTDEWFFGNNKDYNHDLARMSIRMAIAAARTGTSSIKKLFNTLGLSYNNDSIHYPAPGTDTIGYAIGSKTVTGDDGKSINLIVVAVRGGGYKSEWANNFVVGSGTEHEGFANAADTLVFDLRSYISMMPDKQNLRIWITGYSRAAAVSNLTAHRLNELAAEGAIPGLGDTGVYAYCFECPRGVRSDAPGLAQPDENIFNIVNPVDAVPLLAPAKWGFEWYGTTYYLPSREYSYQTFMERFGQMQQRYKSILIRAGAKESAEELTETMPGQQGFLRDTLDSLADYLGGQSNYVRKYQELLFGTLETLQGGGDDGLEPVMRTIVNILPGFFNQHPELTVTLLNNLGNIGRAHYPELCLAWMDAISEEDLTEEIRFRQIKINCPVNVLVYDSEYNLEASIVDGEAYGSDRVDAWVDSNGQKVFALPLDGEFYVEVAATGEGSVFCQIEEYNAGSGETDRLVNYYDIPISKNDQLDIFVGREDSGMADYTLTGPDGETIVPDADLFGSQIEEHSVSVSAEGSGTVTGGGVFRKGEFALVTAVADDGAKFLGWYSNGRKLSSEGEYRFPVEADMALEGRFSEKTGEEELPVINPFVDVKEKDYFYEPVLWAVGNGITSGISADRFAPGDSCTRAQVVTFLWRAAGKPEPASRDNPFEDVSPSAYYYDAVLWAVEKGITSGTGATSFSPNALCTRGQVVTFLWRVAGEPEVDLANNPFIDVKETGFYYEAVIWAVGKGITTGVSSTQFAPGQTCTRGQVVSFLYRAR